MNTLIQLGLGTCLPRARGYTVGGFVEAMETDVSSPCAGVHRLGALLPRDAAYVFPVRGGTPDLSISSTVRA